ncbi:hypothetical protein NGRA_0131 [Nosema granulosis]|uniref:Uncharacterized protein n=1 Tax=Nosema granulosis TaxID=83296 RepID=A0A9P6H0Z9_9MICR|nr:hypothetical protein NGRA_0131 [Nosema granulosis]
MQNIREMMEALNGELGGVRRRSKINVETKRYIPEYKLEVHKEEYFSRCKSFIEKILRDIQAKQNVYNESNQKDRKNYAEKQIRIIQEKLSEFDKEKIQKAKDLVSKIEYLKTYNIQRLPDIQVSEEHTAQIFRFLSEMILEKKYIYLHDFLKRKIKFEYEIPTDREIESLRRLKRFVLQRKL